MRDPSYLENDAEYRLLRDQADRLCAVVVELEKLRLTAEGKRFVRRLKSSAFELVGAAVFSKARCDDPPRRTL
jgi:hypothetical protein